MKPIGGGSVINGAYPVSFITGYLVVGSLTLSGIISIGKGWKRRDDQAQDFRDRRCACKARLTKTYMCLQPRIFTKIVPAKMKMNYFLIFKITGFFVFMFLEVYTNLLITAFKINT